MREQVVDLFGEQVAEKPDRSPKVQGTRADMISAEELSPFTLSRVGNCLARDMWDAMRDDLVAYNATKVVKAGKATKPDDFFGLPPLWPQKIAVFDVLCWAFDLFDRPPLAPFAAVCGDLDLDPCRVRRTLARNLHPELRELFRLIRMAMGESKAADAARKLEDYVNLGNWRNQ
ncbi:hypothetical protein ACU4GI_47165 (plasmid) [Cupriavidus basilensis]